MHLCTQSIYATYELDSGVVEDADAGGREVGADEQLVAVELGAQVRQHGLRAEVLTCVRACIRAPSY
jgi:hypothetical protein